MPLTEKLSIVLDTIGVGGVVRDFNQVSSASKKLAGDAATTGGKFDKLASGLGVSASTLKQGVAGGALAAGAAIAALGVHSVKAFSDMGQQVLAFQRASGATAEQSSLLVAAFDDMGISAETGSKAIFQLGKRVETSTAKLAEFGIVAARDSSGNVDLAGTLLAVADTYKAMSDPAEKAALLTASFGKAGQQLIPILEQGRAGIEAMYGEARATGQVLSQEEIADAEEYRLALDELSDSMEAMALAAGKFLVPILSQMAEGAATIAGWASKVGDVAHAILIGSDNAEGAASGVAELGDAYYEWLAENEAAAMVEELADEVEDLASVTLASTAAQRSFDQATRALASAQRSEADAQDELNDLLKEGRFDLEAIKDAEVSLASAKRSTRNASRDQAKAQREYDAALANANDLRGYDTAQEKLAEAADNLADANDGVAEAQEREADAARALREAQAGDPDWQDKIADARQRVRDATQGVADATYDLGQRAYEAAKAHDAEKAALLGKTDQVALLRTEWEKLIALHPQMLPFLGPVLAGLPAKNQVVSPSFIGPLSGSQQQGVSPGFIGPLSGQQAYTTSNVTVNVATDADPSKIAREVVWALN